MCSLCGSLGGGSHWSDRMPDDASRQRDRALRQQLVAHVAALRGVAVVPFEGDAYLVRGKTPSPERADHLAALWPVVERVSGMPCDPLDARLLAALDADDPERGH